MSDEAGKEVVDRLSNHQEDAIILAIKYAVAVDKLKRQNAILREALDVIGDFEKQQSQLSRELAAKMRGIRDRLTDEQD